MIDSDGYRLNVGMILCNHDRQVLWARRSGMDAWQFPQGGIRKHESPRQALFRELYEEVGLSSDEVEVIGNTRDWLRYRLPGKYQRRKARQRCIGQKQVWFLLRLNGNGETVSLDCSGQPEFDSWRWVDYWYPLEQVIDFKREVYLQALTELAPLILPPGDQQPAAS